MKNKITSHILTKNMCSALHSVCLHTHTHTHTQLLGNPFLMRKKHTCVYADGKVVVQPFFFFFLIFCSDHGKRK